MKRMIWLSIVILFWSIVGNGYAGNNYTYKSACPDGDRYFDGVDSLVCNENDCFYKDRWNFAQCNCTSYVSYRMNNPFNDPDIGGDTDPVYGVPFFNGYKTHWGDGGEWWSAGKKLGITDNNPIPGDAVSFVGSRYGHIAFVEKVEYDANMQWKKVTLSEYNEEARHRYKYGRVITRGDKQWLYNPKGFIHILAYANPEFYFNYYDLGYDVAGQTKEEWEKIYVLVMQRYYKKKNDPRYQSSYQTALNHIGGSLPVGFGGMGGSYTPPSGNYNSNGSGAVEHSQPGESDHAGYVHNVSMDDVEISIAGQDDYDHSITFNHGEVPTVNVRARLKNKTNHEIGSGDVTIKWYESPNKKFNPNYDHHFATDSNSHSIGKFKHHSHSDELVERKTGINHLKGLNPGVYYLYPIFYYEGEENMASNHDHHEYIKVIILPRYNLKAFWCKPDQYNIDPGENLKVEGKFGNLLDVLPHDVRVGFYINGHGLSDKLFYAKVFTSNQMKSQQTFSFQINAPLIPGRYKITMKVDDINKLTETVEGDNQKNFNLWVNALPINGLIDINYGSTDPNNPKVLTENLTAGHCLAGNPIQFQGKGRKNNPWQWTCQGENGGADETGYAIKKGLSVAQKMEILW